VVTSSAGAFLFVAVLGGAFALACGAREGRPPPTSTVNPSTVAAADPRTPLDPASFPPLHPGVVGVLEDFLVLAGTEFFPAVPPCTGYQSTDDYTEDVPLELGYLPDGAEEQERYVSTCPDGTVLSAGYQYELTDGRTLSVAFSRAPHSFPIVLGDPSAGGTSQQPSRAHNRPGAESRGLHVRRGSVLGSRTVRYAEVRRICHGRNCGRGNASGGPACSPHAHR
jgi:hypothetical protein